MTEPSNRVRERREELALSQGALAERVGLSRQSIGAIEADRATPGVDVALRLASALGCSVEQLFAEPKAEASLLTESADPTASGRATVARVCGRWVSFPLGASSTHIAADAIIAHSDRRGIGVELLRPAAELEQNFVILGCALGLGLLADRLNSRPGSGRFHWFSRSSSAALAELGQQRTHVAGIHLTDARTGEDNVSEVKRLGYPEPIALVTLARWELGLLQRRGTAPVRRIADLARPGVRLVGREAGAGTQRWLERELGAHGLPLTLARKPHLQASCHLGVARSIALGAADVGVATRDAAMALELDFVALGEERFDLAIPASALHDPRLQRLLDTLASGEFRRELSAIGYDTREAGKRAGEVHAA